MAQNRLLHLVPGAPQALCDMLDGARGAVQAPIRSEIFGPQRFAQHGRSLGATHRATRGNPWLVNFFPRLRSNIRTLREAHSYINQQALTGYDISPAAEWLLDNFHLIEAQTGEIHQGLPRSYFRTLPILQDEPLAGLPRVYGIAWAFVAHTDSAFDEDLYMRFLTAYQDACELNLSELWAMPTTLRVVLIENLRRLAERVATNKAAREVANLCCDKIVSFSVQQRDGLLSLLRQRGVAKVFLAQVALRLNDQPASDGPTAYALNLDWVHAELPDLALVQAQQPLDQAADNLSLSNAVKSLRALGVADWPGIVDKCNALMRLMLTWPLFKAENKATRDQTLHGIEKLSRRTGLREEVVAQAMLGRIRTASAKCDPGTVASYWLTGPGYPALLASLGSPAPLFLTIKLKVAPLALPIYLAVLLLGTAAVLGWILLHPGSGIHPSPLGGWGLLAFALMLFPASEASVAVINRLISESVRPAYLPRLALADGLQKEHRVMVAIPAMLASPANAQKLSHRLLMHYLANPERHAQFALLTDWVDADTAVVATDQALLDEAVGRVKALNVRYPAESGAPPRFLLLHRPRTFSQTEQAWIGWERKRGKLEQLAQALAVGDGHPFLDLGDLSRIAPDTRYILTLDSDTQLPPGNLRELLAVASHPQNQPRIDPATRTVVSGFGILQPRVVTPLPGVHQLTVFHWLFSGQPGIDAYSAASSEVYQDVFGEGSFAGKGLLHVQTLHTLLAGRLPQDHVLSHDLFEGSLVRCAAVTDVAVIEDEPFHPDVAAARAHRWIRGDWQLLPFLLKPGAFPIRGVNRWKMVDNLRRSLVSPASLALLLLSLSGYGLTPLAALSLLLAAFCAGPVLGSLAAFSPGRADLVRAHFYRLAAIDMVRAVGGGLWWMTQLLRQSLMALDAISRACYRMLISRRQLLQWTTAETAQARASTDLLILVRRQWRVSLVAVLVLGVLLANGSPYPLLCVAVCLCWAASASWIWWFSQPLRAAEQATLTPSDQDYLATLARDTWRLFERCIGPEDHHLPPDNLQILPHDMVAHRTSPTNIGLYLLSCACAEAFGWINPSQMVERIEATLETLAKMSRHRGHFLNWYDTQTLAPLMPMYVSTVDSGNLGGHLLAVAQACLALARKCAAPADGALAHRLRDIAQECWTLAWAPDYTLLYSKERHLFHIGYRVSERQLDESFYDLMASEARLTSLMAIAKGDVPVRHWAALGRPFFSRGSRVGLRSWSGSMFEYLMPTLVLDEPHGSVLCSASLVAIFEQINYGEQQDVPWGFSESAYAARDHTLAYQYAPQGAPGLALRRTPPDELVVAPYAAALAAQIAPASAVRNFKALEAMAARGEYGFFESVDFSAGKQTDKNRHETVCTFMAHHQGMTVVALANVLLDAAPRRWAMAESRLQAVASLLQERTPREVALGVEPPPGPSRADRRQSGPGVRRDVVPGTSALQPTHLLSNGRYSVALRANGAGWSRFGDAFISRWRDDALRDAHGTFFYLRRNPADAPVSITQHPAPDAAAHYEATFHIDRVCLDAHWPDLHTHGTVWVSPEDDIELRQFELHNLSSRAVELDLMSAFEVSLADARADEAHPAFANLFVRAEWNAADRALYFERRPRLATEQGLHAVHFVAQADRRVLGVQVQANRARWLGRQHDAACPLARFDAPCPLARFDAPCPLARFDAPPSPVGDGAAVNGAVAPGTAVELVTGLDPMAALSLRVRLPALGTARFSIATAAARTRAELEALVDKYRQPSIVQRSSMMSATLAAIRLRALRTSAANLAAIQLLSTPLALFMSRALPAGAAPPLDRRALWRLGLSGDRPIVLVVAGDVQATGLVRTLVQALKLWTWGGLPCDLVLLNVEPASYLMPLQRELLAIAERFKAEADDAKPASRACALHIIRADDVSLPERAMLEALARVRLNGDGRPLAQHAAELVEWHDAALDERLEHALVALPAPPPNADAVPARGDFSLDGARFAFDVSAAQRPVRPWVNVLANPDFGCQVSEAGAGYTWAGNSRMHQLTAWSNDAVSDPASEWLLLQDMRSRRVWNVAPGAGGAASGYHVEHAQGTTSIRHFPGDMEVRVTWCVDPLRSVKQVRITLINRGSQVLRLRVIGVAEWLLGASRIDRQSVETARVPLGGADVSQRLPLLTATQRDGHAGFGGATAFMALVQEGADQQAYNAATEWTCDRREVFDARGRLVVPDHLGERSGTGIDPCAALATTVMLVSGGTAACTLLLGHAATADAALLLAREALAVAPAERLGAARAHWNALLGAVTVSTPDPLFDALVNRWLLYQTVVCRLWGRAGFYQAGGAFGFRDQLQDAMALAVVRPAMLRSQLLLAASRQFPEGDVQHWWHAPTGAGVRTHFSDDLLWLAHAAAHYLASTGDAGVLDEVVPFLDGAPVPPGAEDIYAIALAGTQSGTLYEHCARAIDHSLAVGVHGLPLMGSGDWNDGMNRVGIEGRGESVWLAWFLCKLVVDFAPVAEQRGDHARALRWRTAAAGWRAALESAAWDGEWYVRAFFDDGSALGSHTNDECRIDLIAQAWSVLSGAAPRARQEAAMASVERLLVDAAGGLVRLLDPPLARAQPSAGYIQAYPPGIRENGGQYSHAGVWALMAHAELGHRNEAWRMFEMLSPAHRASDAGHGDAYEIEPYVMAGDTYTQPPYVGRGGWSWYTGSAAWLYRAALESILGLQVRGNQVRLNPQLAPHWPSATVVLRRGTGQHEFRLCRPREAGFMAQAHALGARLLNVGEWATLTEPTAVRGAVAEPVATSRYLVVMTEPGAAVLQDEVPCSDASSGAQAPQSVHDGY